MQKQVEEDKWITIKILRSQNNQVSEIVKRSAHFHNNADFIRDAIRGKVSKHQKSGVAV